MGKEMLVKILNISLSKKRMAHFRFKENLDQYFRIWVFY